MRAQHSKPWFAAPNGWTIEWAGAGDGGVWMLFHNGVHVSTHTYKWQARLARRKAANSHGRTKS